jgi:hypothetical protein
MSDFTEFQVIPWYQDQSFLHQKYVVEKQSTQQIADLCFSSRATVSKYLTLHGIAIRSQDEWLSLNKGQLAWGEKRLRGMVQRNQSEMRVVDIIARLRKHGYSYRKIGAWLDAKGIKTKNGYRSWKATTVMKIFKRHRK